MGTQLQQTSPAIVPLIVVWQSSGGFTIASGGSPSGEGPSDQEAIQMGRYLASRGIVFIRWIQGDYIGSAVAPEGADEFSVLNLLWYQFGF
jgi:hypothetical protein